MVSQLLPGNHEGLDKTQLGDAHGTSVLDHKLSFLKDVAFAEKLDF
jgi:hypothetical protein